MLEYQINEVEGFKSALHGMRNPMNSWVKQDTEFCRFMLNRWGIKMGPKDLKLAKSLVLAGSDHAKFLRMIQVYADITAPLYWWKEYDTYKVGTVANSCSTMHKITEKEFTEDDFSHEHLINDLSSFGNDSNDILWRYIHDYDKTSGKDLSTNRIFISHLNETIENLNLYRYLYLRAKEDKNESLAKEMWWQLIQLLPSSYNQKRTIMLNYAVLRNIYFARKDHKLDEWHTFCDMIRELPYADDLITITKE